MNDVIEIILDNPEEVTVPLERLAMLERSQIASVLSAGLAHELAGPLIPLLSALEQLSQRSQTLQSRALPPDDSVLAEMDECLDLASTAAQAMVATLRDYQAFMRPGAPARSDGSCDPLPAVERAVRMARPRIEAVATLWTTLSCVPMLRGPVGGVTQIVLNLLNNAVDACDSGSRSGRIDVRLWSADGSVLLEVEDNGPGIAEAALKNLFQPNITGKPNSESLGMGLAIARALARRLGGELAVSSRLGQGTTLRVSFPVGGTEPDAGAAPPSGPAAEQRQK